MAPGCTSCRCCTILASAKIFYKLLFIFDLTLNRTRRVQVLQTFQYCLIRVTYYLFYIVMKTDSLQCVKITANLISSLLINATFNDIVIFSDFFPETFDRDSLSLNY